jgi:predicted ATPase
VLKTVIITDFSGPFLLGIPKNRLYELSHDTVEVKTANGNEIEEIFQ